MKLLVNGTIYDTEKDLMIFGFTEEFLESHIQNLQVLLDSMRRNQGDTKVLVVAPENTDLTREEIMKKVNEVRASLK